MASAWHRGTGRPGGRGRAPDARGGGSAEAAPGMPKGVPVGRLPWRNRDFMVVEGDFMVVLNGFDGISCDWVGLFQCYSIVDVIFMFVNGSS